MDSVTVGGRGRAVLCLAVGLLAAIITASATSEILSLQPRAPVTGELSPGEEHVYRLPALPGGPLRVLVEQQGIDLMVKASSGSSSVAVDAPNERWGGETLLVPAGSGFTHLSLRATEKGAPAGSYVVTVEVLATATERDRNLLAAEANLSRGGKLHHDDPADAAVQREALAVYRKARDGFRQLGERRREAEAQDNVARLEFKANKPKAVVAEWTAARDLWRELGDARREASAELYVGYCHWKAGETAMAREPLERALRQFRELGDRFGEAQTLTILGHVEHTDGDWNTTRQHYSEAYALFRQLGDVVHEARLLTSLGGVAGSMGEPDEALSSYQQALSLYQGLGEPVEQARTLNNIGVAYRSVGRWQDALTAYHDALALLADHAEPRFESTVLNNLGSVYLSVGEPERALPFFERALDRRRETGYSLGQVVTHNNLGRTRRQLGELDTALAEHQQALEIAKDLGNRLEEGITRGHLAETTLTRGDTSTALTESTLALGLFQELGNEARRRHLLLIQGRALTLAGEPLRALPILAEALTLCRRSDRRAQIVDTLGAIAEAQAAAGNVVAARKRMVEALDLVESLRQEVVSPDLRTAFFATQRRSYGLAIDLLLTPAAGDPPSGNARVAFALSERARARGLVDLLHESGAGLGRDMPQELRQRRLDLDRRLVAKLDSQRDLEERGRMAEAALLTPDIELLRAERDQQEAVLRRASPRYAALRAPSTLDATAAQELLDNDTVLLELALGEQRSFRFSLTANSLTVQALPCEKELVALARKAYDELRTPTTSTAPGSGESATMALSRVLLAPVYSQLGSRRLLVVPDGFLHYIPFAALPIPASSGSEPLVTRHEIVQLPSATVLAELRRTALARSPAPRQIAIFADPVFNEWDPRVAGPAKPAPPNSALRLPNLLRDGVGKFLDRLPASRQEAEAIAALAPAGDATITLDFDAHRDAVLDADLDQYRILHFATHAFLDERHPELSGLALSAVTPEGRPRDGFLRLADIYDLRLRADLVVLSACQTALGREIHGEGLMGLTRAFLHAGTPRVLASLWPVEDKAAAAFMEHFYLALWRDDLAPAAALRRTQLSLRGDHRFHDPFFWAAFVLQGEWQ